MHLMWGGMTVMFMKSGDFDVEIILLTDLVMGNNEGRVFRQVAMNSSSGDEQPDCFWRLVIYPEMFPYLVLLGNWSAVFDANQYREGQADISESVKSSQTFSITSNWLIGTV